MRLWVCLLGRSKCREYDCGGRIDGRGCGYMNGGVVSTGYDEWLWIEGTDVNGWNDLVELK